MSEAVKKGNGDMVVRPSGELLVVPQPKRQGVITFGFPVGLDADARSTRLRESVLRAQAASGMGGARFVHA